MNSTQGWDSTLRSPHARDHVVQLYTDEGFLVRAVSHFVGRGLADSEAAVIIATPGHGEAFTRALTAEMDVRAAVARTQLTMIDAESCLTQFMVDGVPDRAAFFAVVDGVLARVRAAGYEKIRLFGEMVNLLWPTNLPATLQLEQYWNEVLAAHGLSLLCAYRLDNFDHDAHRGLLHEITCRHSHLIPVDDYGRLEDAVDRAWDDVFGSSGEARTLREVMTTQQRVAAAMPPAQAALFASRTLSPPLANEILERARHYYRGAPTALEASASPGLPRTVRKA